MDNKNEQQQYYMYILLSLKQIKLQCIEEEETKKLTLFKQVAESNSENELHKEIFKLFAYLKSKKKSNAFSKNPQVKKKVS